MLDPIRHPTQWCRTFTGSRKTCRSGSAFTFVSSSMNAWSRERAISGVAIQMHTDADGDFPRQAVCHCQRLLDVSVGYLRIRLAERCHWALQRRSRPTSPCVIFPGGTCVAYETGRDEVHERAGRQAENAPTQCRLIVDAHIQVVEVSIGRVQACCRRYGTRTIEMPVARCHWLPASTHASFSIADAHPATRNVRTRFPCEERSNAPWMRWHHDRRCPDATEALLQAARTRTRVLLIRQRNE